MLGEAIPLEVTGTTSMKLSQRFTRVLPSVLIFVFYARLFVGLTLALKRLALSVVYAIWVGIGAVLITLIGFWYFDEQATLFKAACIALIVIGVVGLNYSTNV